MKKIILFIIITINCFANIIAQNNTKTPNDEQNTPPDYSFFNDAESKFAKNYRETQLKNIANFNLFSLGRGYLGFSYEHAISNRLAFNTGIGTYFTQDKLLNDGLFLYTSSTNTDYIDVDEIVKFTNIEPFKSFNFSFGTRLYEEVDELENRNFLNISYQYNYLFNSINNKKFDSLYQSVFFIERPNVNFSSSLFSITYGRQWNYNIGKLIFTHELSYGLGLRTIGFKKIVLKDYKTPYYQNGEYYYQYFSFKNYKIQEFNLAFLIHYKLGIGW